MKYYFDNYNDFIYLQFHGKNIFSMLLNVSLHENIEIYRKTVNNLYYDISENLRHWIYIDLEDKIVNGTIKKNETDKIFTDIFSNYSLYEDRYDYNYGCYNSGEEIDVIEHRLYGCVRLYDEEKLENIKLLDFCTKYNICIDYERVFTHQITTRNYFTFLIGKISDEYVSKTVVANYDEIDLQTLNEINICFPNMVLREIPTRRCFWRKANVDKVKFLFKFFKDEDFYSVITETTSLKNVQCILDNATLEKYMYENIASVVGKYKNHRTDDPKIAKPVYTLIEKHGNRKKILDLYLLNIMIHSTTPVLDELCALGASVNNDQDLENTICECLREDNFDAIKWLHGKDIDLIKYQNMILKNIVTFCIEDTFDFFMFLQQIGFDKIDESILACYVWRSKPDQEKIKQYILTKYDNDLVKICRSYSKTAKKYLYDNKFDNTKFNKQAEQFDFRTDNYMFFKCVSLLSTVLMKDGFEHEQLPKLFKMIKYYYPTVIFYCDNNCVDFTIKQTKSSRNI